MFSHAIKFFRQFYQIFVSPILHFLVGPGFGCRFVPSCSMYSSEAFEKFGFLKGLAMTLHRLCRCHPLSRAGYDPVPENLKN